MARGVRQPGEACVCSEDARWVARACREGLGGAEAWGFTRGNVPPHIWLHLAHDETTRWRVAEGTASAQDFTVEVLWVAAIPNERLAHQLRVRAFAEARHAEWLWDVNDHSAWSAAERDMADSFPAPFAWPGEPCVGGPAEGDGGVPAGLIRRAEGVTWRALSASPWRVFVRAYYEVQVYGELAEQLRRGVRLREQITEVREQAVDILWIRQPGDTSFYGDPACPHCDGDGPCYRCRLCRRRGVTVYDYFSHPIPPLVGPEAYSDDLWTLQDLRILPWGAAALF